MRILQQIFILKKTDNLDVKGNAKRLSAAKCQHIKLQMSVEIVGLACMCHLIISLQNNPKVRHSEKENDKKTPNEKPKHQNPSPV